MLIPGRFLSRFHSDAWEQSMDGSGVAKYLEAHGHKVVAHREFISRSGGGSYAELEDGTRVYNNGYVSPPNP